MILTEGHFETINNYDFAWTDIQKPTRDRINMLGKQYPFHELNLDDCLSKVHIPKIDKYKDHLFIILNFPLLLYCMICYCSIIFVYGFVLNYGYLISF